MREKKSKEINMELVNIRDALAHGRVSASEMELPLRLMKFENSKGKTTTRITNNILLTEEWFHINNAKVREAIYTVVHQLNNS